jgi:amicyanin
VNYVAGNHTLAVVDSSLAMASAQQASLQSVADGTMVKIDNFSFSPKSLTVRAGATVTWMNQDDIPHNVVSTEKKFSSPVLDTDQNFSFTFREPGSYPYYCKIHPMMTGTVVVEKDASGKA